MTMGISKQLLPIYARPMVYYSTSAMLADTWVVLVISTPHDLPLFERLLGIEQLGVRSCTAFKKNAKPFRRIHRRTFLYRRFVRLPHFWQYRICSQSLLSLTPCGTKIKRATIFLCPLADLERYGFLEFDAQGKVNGIEEKPKNRNSNFPIALKESQTYEQRKINSPVFSRLALQKRQAFNLLSCLRKAFFFLRWQRVYLFGNRNI